MNKPRKVVYKDLEAVYVETVDMWRITPIGAPSMLGNILAVVHGNDRKAVKKKMQELYNERFPGRRK